MHTRVGGSRRATLARRASTVLVACLLGCAGSGGRTGRPTAVPDFVRTTGPCWVGGRITLDPTLFPTQADDELASLSCENLVVVQKSEDGSTKLVHADGFFAQGYGECRYQFTDVPEGTSSYSGRVVALSVPESRYALSSAVEFNAVRCGGSLASLNQQLDFLLTIPDVRGR
ncbi:MAG: hypothetical protein ACLQIH_17170 [Myxococcaceae bacterium]